MCARIRSVPLRLTLTIPGVAGVCCGVDSSFIPHSTFAATTRARQAREESAVCQTRASLRRAPASARSAVGWHATEFCLHPALPGGLHSLRAASPPARTSGLPELAGRPPASGSTPTPASSPIFLASVVAFFGHGTAAHHSPTHRWRGGEAL